MFFVYKRLGNRKYALVFPECVEGRLRVTATVTGIKYD